MIIFIASAEMILSGSVRQLGVTLGNVQKIRGVTQGLKMAVRTLSEHLFYECECVYIHEFT